MRRRGAVGVAVGVAVVVTALPAVANTQSAAAVPAPFRLAPDLPRWSSFGEAVSVTGDTLLVGAPDDDAPEKGSGSVRVYVDAGGGWAEQAELTSPEPLTFGSFGEDVAVDGDTLVIGQTPRACTAGEPQHNAAYVYVGAGADWTLQAVLQSSDIGADDSFGNAVDVDGDTLVVGADFDTAAGLDDAGSAYVFQRTGSTWTEEAQLLASEADVSDRFGQAVSIDGKVIFVTAYSYQVGSTGYGAGAAYVFRRSDGSWTERRVLVPPDATGASTSASTWTSSRGPSAGAPL